METTSETIQIIGYGSLLLEKSARLSVPNLTGFRIVRVPNYIRIFNKVGVVFHSRRGIATNLQRFAYADLKANGVNWIVGNIEAENVIYEAGSCPRPGSVVAGD